MEVAIEERNCWASITFMSKAHRGADGGLEVSPQTPRRVCHGARVTVGGSTGSDADLQLVESLELSAHAALCAVYLDNVFGARADADARRFQGADGTVVEAHQSCDIVFVFDRSDLVADLEAGATHTHLRGIGRSLMNVSVMALTESMRPRRTGPGPPRGSSGPTP